MKICLFILSLIFIISCSKDNEKVNSGTEKISVDSLSTQEDDENAFHNLGLQEKNLKYSYRNDSIVQRLTVKFSNNIDTIRFTYSILNKIANLSKSYDGIAVSDPMQIEASEDEEGNMYPVKVYYSKSNCWFGFSFDYKKYEWLSIKAADCTEAENKQLNSIDILRLEK